MPKTIQESLIDPIPLMDALEPKVAELYDRHVKISDKNLWLPDSYVPWSYAKDFNPDEPWNKDDLPVTPALVSSLEVNLLTEDNLPYYFRDIDLMYGSAKYWGKWARRWTAEEGRHSIVLRNGLFATRLVDPVQLESDRMSQVEGGETPKPKTPLHGLIYVSLQELATRISHKNTADELQRQAQVIDSDDTRHAIDKFIVGIKRTAIDENLHYLFYKDVSAEAFRLDPEAFLEAVADVVRHFAMPGVGIRDFEIRSRQIADLGIYNVAIHSEEIVKHVLLKQWKIDTFTDWGYQLSAQKAKAIEDARQKVLRTIKLVDRAASISPHGKKA